MKLGDVVSRDQRLCASGISGAATPSAKRAPSIVNVDAGPRYRRERIERRVPATEKLDLASSYV
jgi:hypothetical protein